MPALAGAAAGEEGRGPRSGDDAEAGCGGRRQAGPHARADGGRAQVARSARGAHQPEDPAGGLQRAPARRSDDRFLVQSLQRLRRQGSDAAVPHRVRTRRDPAARLRQVPRSARRHGRESRDALLSRQLAERGSRRGQHAGSSGGPAPAGSSGPGGIRASARAVPMPPPRSRTPTRSRGRSAG